MTPGGATMALGRSGEATRYATARPGAPDRVPGRAATATREVAVGLLVLVVYVGFTHAFAGPRAVSDTHGRWLLNVERWPRLDVERALNEVLVRHGWLGALAAWEYATTYVIGTFGFLGYLWWKRSPIYSWARNTLIFITMIGVCCFALWPVTPPRLLPGEGYADIIAIHHPPATWGTGVVSAGANPYAAMPSLHIGWVAWIGVTAVRARCGVVLAWICALHLVVTGLVIVATAAHYVLDIPGGLLLVPAAAGAEWLRVRYLRSRRPRKRAPRVAAADVFFLYAETPDVPQVVGGVAGFGGPGPTVAEASALMAGRLPLLPRLAQRVTPAGLLRRPRWAEAGQIDLAWHVQELHLPAPGDRRSLDALVARLVAVPLDRDRPLWRLWLVRGRDEDAVVVLVHHVVADGIGVVDILRAILEPRLPRRPPDRVRGAGRPARAASAVPGLVLLGLDGAAPTVSITGTLGPERAFGTATLPLDRARAVARAAGVPVTDMLLTLVGQAVADVLGERGEPVTGRVLRAAVPMTLRRPAPRGRFGRRGRTAVPGNLTEALWLDVPVDPMPVRDRLLAVHRSAERRRRSGRGPAGTAVMRIMGLLPPGPHALAVRAVYGARFFGVIVSTMPGPQAPLSLAGAPLGDVHPILPLAGGVPLAVGALSWDGLLHVSVTAEPRVLPEAEGFPERLTTAFDRLTAELGEPDRRPERSSSGAEPGGTQAGRS